jgi:hypothetical protein
MANSTLAGHSFDVDLGPFVPRLSFLNDTQMRLQAKIGPTTIDEVVTIDVTTVRTNVFVVAWTEKSGNFIVQVQDHERGIVHNHARLADGQLFQARGAIKPILVE